MNLPSSFPPRPSSSPLRTSSRAWATGLLAILVVFSIGCRAEPEEVQEEALAEDTLVEEQTDAGAEVEVAEAGPAAWQCRRYLDLTDETGALYDEEAAAEAEDYVDSLFTAEEAEDVPALTPPEVPLRTALRDACRGNEDLLLSDVVDQAFGNTSADASAGEDID